MSVCSNREAFARATGKWSSKKSAGSRRYTSCQLARLLRIGPFKAVACSRRGPLSASSLPRRASHPRPPPHPLRSSSPASERVSVGSRAVDAGSGRSSRHSTRFSIESRWCRTTCDTDNAQAYRYSRVHPRMQTCTLDRCTSTSTSKSTVHHLSKDK